MSMQAILAASQSMLRMQTMQSARTQMQGTADILRIESKQDRGDEKKEFQASELDKQSDTLMGDLMKQVTEVNKTLNPDEEVKAKEDAEQKALEERMHQNADSLELSDTAAEYLALTGEKIPLVGEAVSYGADGSVTQTVLADIVSAFIATA